MKCDTPMTFEEAKRRLGIVDRKPLPMTNEEYLKSLDTKQLARIIYELMWHKEKYHELCVYPVVDSVVEWLKQPHKDGES